MVAKPPGERLIRINISLTPEQLQKIDQRVTSDRSALIRSIVQDWLNRQEKKITSPENLRDNFGLDIATEADFEITFNAYANTLKSELLECFHNGYDVSCLVPVFARFMRELVRKQAQDDQIQLFLHEKLLEVAESRVEVARSK